MSWMRSWDLIESVFEGFRTYFCQNNCSTADGNELKTQVAMINVTISCDVNTQDAFISMTVPM